MQKNPSGYSRFSRASKRKAIFRCHWDTIGVTTLSDEDDSGGSLSCDGQGVGTEPIFPGYFKEIRYR